MPENWPVKSDYNWKWVIGAWPEAKGACGFNLKILKKLCSKFLHGKDVHPHLACPKD